MSLKTEDRNKNENPTIAFLKKGAKILGMLVLVILVLVVVIGLNDTRIESWVRVVPQPCQQL